MQWYVVLVTCSLRVEFAHWPIKTCHRLPIINWSLPNVNQSENLERPRLNNSYWKLLHVYTDSSSCHYRINLPLLMHISVITAEHCWYSFKYSWDIPEGLSSLMLHGCGKPRPAVNIFCDVKHSDKCEKKVRASNKFNLWWTLEYLWGKWIRIHVVFFGCTSSCV